MAAALTMLATEHRSVDGSCRPQSPGKVLEVDGPEMCSGTLRSDARRGRIEPSGAEDVSCWKGEAGMKRRDQAQRRKVTIPGRTR